MPYSERKLLKAAFKKAATWGTEVDVNSAGNQVLPLNPGVGQQAYELIPEESSVSAFPVDLNYGDFVSPNITLDYELRYDTALWVMLAMVLGTAGTPVQQGSTTAWKHRLQLAGSLAGLFGTYAYERWDKIFVMPSMKPYKIKFSLKGGQILCQVSCRCSHKINNSAVVTSLSSITVPSKHLQVLARHGVLRMNAQGGAALGGGDEIRPESYELDIERKPDEKHVVGQRYIVEPLEPDKLSVTLSMTWPRMDAGNAGYFAEALAESEKKADLIFTGPLIEDTYYHKLTLSFPRLRYVPPVEDIEGGVVGLKTTFQGLEADAAPTGMTGITKPVDIELINTKTTDLLG